MEFRLYIPTTTPPGGSQRGKKSALVLPEVRDHYFPVSKALLLSLLGSADLTSNLAHHLENLNS